MIFRCAGILGVDPWKWTLRELEQAARARLETEWDQTAAVMWLLAEINRDRKRHPSPFPLSKFNPMVARQPDEGRRKLTRQAFREQARAWYQKQGLPLPDKLRNE